jgi:hypothetical protein
MKVVIKTKFNADFDFVWNKVMKPATLEFIACPLVKFKAIDPPNFPKTWEVGAYKTKLKVLGFIPFGYQYIVIEIPENKDFDKRVLIDNGYGSLISKWYHIIEIKKINENITEYTDNVEVKAGLLTPFIWLYAYIFYSWRQRRWQSLILQK